jgi:hypothetical protein
MARRTTNVPTPAFAPLTSIESDEHRRRDDEARERPSMRRCAATASTLPVARLWMISDSAVHAFIAGTS